MCSHPSECVMMGWSPLFMTIFSWMLSALKSTGIIAVRASIKGCSAPWYFTAWIYLSAGHYHKIYIHAHYLGQCCSVFCLCAVTVQLIVIHVACWQQRHTGQAAWCIWNQRSCDLPAISLWILARFCLMNISWGRGNSRCTYPTPIITHTPSLPIHYTPLHRIHTHTLPLNLSLFPSPHLETQIVFNNQ